MNIDLPAISYCGGGVPGGVVHVLLFQSPFLTSGEGTKLIQSLPLPDSAGNAALAQPCS